MTESRATAIPKRGISLSVSSVRLQGAALRQVRPALASDNGDAADVATVAPRALTHAPAIPEQIERHMSRAYVISEVAIVDERLAAQYREIAAASIAAHGGRYLVRGAAANVVEGATTNRRIVIVEFPSMERAKAWYDSAEYASARLLREVALERRLIFVEGVESR